MTQPGSGFGQFIPGFDFLQKLAGQPGVSQASAWSGWVAPTFSVEELDKRIGELKAVQFWLEQNAKALAATIQALEVQKMTLATLRTMNFNLGEMADAFKAGAATADAATTRKGSKTVFAGLEVPERTFGRPAADEARATKRRKPATRQKAAAAPAEAAAAGPAVDPMQWWGALTQQFQQIAAQAMQDMASTAAPAPAGQATPRRAARAQGRRAPAGAEGHGGRRRGPAAS
jgi:hypothetical protein